MLVIELLNLINVVGNIFFLDAFLGGEFSAYGIEVRGLCKGACKGAMSK